MTAALTPDLALDYLSELSADIRAAIVLDAGGDVLAVRRADVARVRGGGVGGGGVARAGGGEADGEALADHAGLAEAARDFLAQAPVVRALTERGGAFGARDDRHAIVVATGPLVLPGLAMHDIRAVLAALGGTPYGAPVSDASPASAEALLNAL